MGNINEKNFNDKIIRFITGLQNDEEASIRTNAIIFLGKVSNLLRENVRNTALIGAFIKAMRDNFKPCRVAALKAAKLVVATINPGQLATKLLPQICLLLVDPSSDVRNMAISVMEGCIELIGKHNSTLPEDPVVVDNAPNTPPRSNSGSAKDNVFTGSRNSSTESFNKADIPIPAMLSSSNSLNQIDMGVRGLKLEEKISLRQNPSSSFIGDDMNSDVKGWGDDLDISDDEPAKPSKIDNVKSDLQKVKKAATVAKKLEKTSFDNWDDF